MDGKRVRLPLQQWMKGCRHVELTELAAARRGLSRQPSERKSEKAAEICKVKVFKSVSSKKQTDLEVFSR